MQDSVILWTRVAPTMEHDTSNVTVEGDVELYSHETERWIAASSRPICIDWRVHRDEELSGEPTASGRGYTTSDIDYTFKVMKTVHMSPQC
jgi:alkaline phosphatase D